MEVIDAVRQLGVAIQQDERYIKYNLAKQKNDEDELLQDLIGQFNLLRITLNEEFSKEANKDDDKVKEANEKLRSCYDEIMQNENMIAFNTAKQQLDEMMNRVNSIISLTVEGEDPITCEPSSCTGSCSSCSGCH